MKWKIENERWKMEIAFESKLRRTSQWGSSLAWQSLSTVQWI